LEKTVSVVLLPDIARNIDAVLSHMHPINEKHGFMAEMKLAEILDDVDKRIVRQVLNAGSVHQRVQRADEAGSHYFIHRDLYQTLARLRARTLFTSTAYRLDSGPHGETPAFAGSLADERPALEHRPGDRGSQNVPVPAQEPALVARSDSGDQRTIRERLMMAMGIAPSAYRDLLRSGALPHANALGQQLGRLCNQKLIGVHINSELQDLNEELERAADTLKHEEFSADQIDKVVFDLQAVLPALLLQQGGRYQETLVKLIDSLERANGEGHLDLKEQQLLQRLKFHESALSKIARSEGADWQRVAVLIENFADSAASGDYRPESDNRRPN
jgi:hypothetical protein